MSKKSVNKAEVSRRTDINKSHLSELFTNEKTRLKAEELCLIAIDSCERLKEIYADIDISKRSKK